MAQAVRFDRHGGPDVLHVTDVPTPDPGPDEVVVRVVAAGLNYIDTYHRTGYYPVAALPSGIGVEGAGIVAQVGASVATWQPGDRVAWVLATPGSCAEMVVVPAGRLVRVPPSISLEAAAAMMLKGMTARYLLKETYAVKRGDTILVQAAAGGVGLILTQWAASLDVTVIGTVGSEEKAELARAAGCTYPILYRDEDVAARVNEITGGEGVPVVYDSVGRDTMAASLASLRRRGVLVSFGQSSGAVEGFDPVLLSRHGSLYLTRPTLFHYIATRDELETTAGDLFAAVTDGLVSIPVRQRWPLAAIADAHRALEGRATVGSTVLDVTREA